VLHSAGYRINGASEIGTGQAANGEMALALAECGDAQGGCETSRR
jgi:hypothetical protein